jgi:hypothetical protein
LFIGAPLLGWFKSRSPEFARRHADPDTHLVGDDLRAVVVRGTASMRPPAGRRRPAPAEGPTPGKAAAPAAIAPSASSTQVLSHPPRPRKKKRR